MLTYFGSLVVPLVVLYQVIRPVPASTPTAISRKGSQFNALREVTRKMRYPDLFSLSILVLPFVPMPCIYYLRQHIYMNLKNNN